MRYLCIIGKILLSCFCVYYFIRSRIDRLFSISRTVLIPTITHADDLDVQFTPHTLIPTHAYMYYVFTYQTNIEYTSMMRSLGNPTHISTTKGVFVPVNVLDDFAILFDKNYSLYKTCKNTILPPTDQNPKKEQDSESHQTS